MTLLSTGPLATLAHDLQQILADYPDFHFRANSLAFYSDLQPMVCQILLAEVDGER